MSSGDRLSEAPPVRMTVGSEVMLRYGWWKESSSRQQCTALQHGSGLCLWAEDGGILTAFFTFFFFSSYCSPLPTRLLSSWLMQSEGAPVDGVDVNHPSVYERRPPPRGEAEDVN